MATKWLFSVGLKNESGCFPLDLPSDTSPLRGPPILRQPFGCFFFEAAISRAFSSSSPGFFFSLSGEPPPKKCRSQSGGPPPEDEPPMSCMHVFVDVSGEVTGPGDSGGGDRDFSCVPMSRVDGRGHHFPPGDGFITLWGLLVKYFGC